MATLRPDTVPVYLQLNGTAWAQWHSRDGRRGDHTCAVEASPPHQEHPATDGRDRLSPVRFGKRASLNQWRVILFQLLPGAAWNILAPRNQPTSSG
jgi:hypothetical protein